MPSLRFLIPDLSCGHCVRAVTAATLALDPQAVVEVDLDTRCLRVETSATPEQLHAALQDAGYTPQGLDH